MNSENKGLVGLHVYVEISEPWEFETDNGPGARTALIEEVRDTDIMIKLEKPIRVKGKLCDVLIASARYEGHSILELMQGGPLSASMTAISMDNAKKVDPFALSSWKTGMGLIGTIYTKRSHRPHTE